MKKQEQIFVVLVVAGAAAAAIGSATRTRSRSSALTEVARFDHQVTGVAVTRTAAAS